MVEQRRILPQYRILIPAVTGVLLVIALVAWLRSGRRDASDAGVTAKVERRAFAASIAAVGAVKPQIGAEVRVGSRISGRVWRLRANIGDRVQRGQIIAELETAELDALIAQRRAELALASAKLASIASLGPEEVAQAQAEVTRFDATAKNAADVWQRQQALLRDGVATQVEADAARERNLVAQAQLESARRALALVRTGNTERHKQAEAEQARAQAAVQSALIERSFTVLRAPTTGNVASISTQEGETVAAGLNAPTFVTIVDLSRLQVNAYVDEVDIGQVQVGQSVRFTVDAFPGRDFEGAVAAIYPSATIQDNVVKYVVAVSIAGNYTGLLRPEMTASVRIKLPSRSVLAVPARAIRRADGRNVVYVVKDGRPTAQIIRVGRRDGPWTEILEGVREGETILLDYSPRTGQEEPQ